MSGAVREDRSSEAPSAHDAPTVADVACITGEAAIAQLGSSIAGLSSEEAARRLARYGPNSLGVRRVTVLTILWRQLRNPLLALLLAAAAVSGLTGDPTDASIIAAIVVLSVGLGFVNEYRAANAVAALHRDIHHETTVWRDGRPATIDVAGLVPGDIVALRVGDIVPADLRVLEATQLECDEAVLTGESLPGREDERGRPAAGVGARAPVLRVHGHGRPSGRRPRRRRLDGHVHRRSGRSRSVSRRRQAETAFQVGLRGFSRLLVKVAAGADGLDLRDQRALLAAAHRCAALLARDRDRHHAAAASGDRVGQPLERVASARAQAGAREAARHDRGSRQHRGAVHRQDRHAHRGRDHLPRGARRRPAPSSAAAAARRPALQRGEHDREPGRSAATRSTSRCSSAPAAAPLLAAADGVAAYAAPRSAALRPRAPAGVGRRPRRRTASAADHEGRARGGARALRRCAAGGARSARAALRGRGAGRRRRHARGARARRADAGRRARPAARGLPDVRRPARRPTRAPSIAKLARARHRR